LFTTDGSSLSPDSSGAENKAPMSHLYYFESIKHSYADRVTKLLTTRRSFLAAAGLLTGATLVRSTLVAQRPVVDLASFLTAYDDAWARHDPHALATLHTKDVLVVNRFGSMVEGRDELERVLAFLHGPGGPFQRIDFPRQQLLVSRMLSNDMATLHASWKNPVMGPGDQVAHPGEQEPWVDMISTYLLAHKGEGWQIVQHDLHSVDPIRFPFKTKWNS
jgi:hypothetical protein